MRTVLVHRPEVVDYQVHQTSRGVAVSLLTSEHLDPHPLRADLVQALSGAGLAAPDVTVAIVEDLPRDPRTGTLRRFVPLG